MLSNAVIEMMIRQGWCNDIWVGRRLAPATANLFTGGSVVVMVIWFMHS